MDLTSKWITLINRYYYIYLNSALEPFGVNASQYLYIIVICNEPGITQSKLPERLGINKSNVTRSLAQLEKEDFIYRVCNIKDKKTTDIFPTKKAYNIYPHIMDAVKRWDSFVTDFLSDDEKLLLQSFLQLLANHAKDFIQKK